MNEFSLHLPGVEPDNIDESRMLRIMAELSHALRQTDRETLKAWGNRSGKRLWTLLLRRGSAFARLAGKLVHAGIVEGRGLASAVHAGRGLEQLGARSAAAIDASISFAQGGKLALKQIRQALRDDPQRNIPRLVAGILGFHAGSGGLDGNGGIPDLDLAAGIGFHRSLLTHSILAGVLAEGLLVAIVDLSGEIKDRLPEVHDPLWAKLAEAAGPLASPLLAGTSAGIAYHLLVDATLQTAAYHGLPWHMPMHDHELAMGVNGVAEGAYAAGMGGKNGAECSDDQQRAKAAPTTGRRVVDGIAQAASKAIHASRSRLERP
ncbi:hypothetical protein [Niveibacterium sp.]|uniref:hypothetical protein n=1 Tax=Niveibacterium sp. TaxID=2017444 RepID=UPI0035AE309B